MQIVQDQSPSYNQISRGQDFLFIFIVDRSGSMGACKRIQTVVDALKIFLRSLPQGSFFSIISFGSNYQLMKVDGQEMIKFDQKNVKVAIDQLEKFDADFGGTNILKPIEHAIAMQWPNQKRIFMLTDGMVDNKLQVIERSKGTNNMKIHAFGIGDGCDKQLVENVAVNGRGSFSLISDDKSHLVGARIIKALEKAFEPSFQNCKLVISHGTKEIT